MRSRRSSRPTPLSPGAPRTSVGQRAVSLELGRLLEARKSLIAETVFANEAYFRLIRRAKEFGYTVRLVFVGVPTVEDAIERVAARVTNGGHDVRESDIRRRWPIAHTNLARAVLSPKCRLIELDIRDAAAAKSRGAMVMP